MEHRLHTTKGGSYTVTDEIFPTTMARYVRMIATPARRAAGHSALVVAAAAKPPPKPPRKPPLR